MAKSTFSYADFINDPDRSCAVVVHRGMWQAAPENSLLAIERAIVAGHDVVEIDVRQTEDGEYVLLHDDTLERMTGLDRRPETMSSRELLNLRLRNRDGGEENVLTDEKLPILADVLDLTRGRIFIHIDVKHRNVIPGVIDFAIKQGVDQQVDFWAELKNEADYAWIIENVSPPKVLFIAKTRLNGPDATTQQELMLRLSPLICEVYFDNLDQVISLATHCKEIGTSLWYNTLDPVACGRFTDIEALKDPDAIWGRLIDAGISAIQTDFPNELKAFLNRDESPQGDRRQAGR
ncbi:glycerophosphodiester phosphodiesterase family protein [Mesorhizobium sp. WSM4884]|uniref:glycerophosphodiester phosphodiesterase family protein n=1 Tax=Mesorhizobium sp. WSM4884 TaxID=3038542 RepID=UPI002415D37F|nr:glycerophosphodiester phosphodiesterase family protein [Mesorhizobium sp. WSM4884]MDG4882038.1 glycerophosphodiester phosphodiesterase family protein [Mesorhizobium sp. WSM4884]